jgi:hypothetical protein
LPYCVAVAALSSRKIGALAGVSHQAVAKAVRRGYLVPIDGSTRLDPEASPNREWIERRAGRAASASRSSSASRRENGRSLRSPEPIEQAAESVVGIPASLSAPEAPPETLVLREGLFSDWTALHIDRDAADRLLAQVPTERADQLPFLTLMLEGMRAAVAAALEAQRAQMRAELLALWQAVVDGRQDLAALIGILGGEKTATAAQEGPKSEGIPKNPAAAEKAHRRLSPRARRGIKRPACQSEVQAGQVEPKTSPRAMNATKTPNAMT